MAWQISSRAALMYLTFTNMMIYADRGILASVIKTLESSDEGMGLSNEEAGSLGSFFMFGFMLTGFFFAHYSQMKHPFTLIAGGLFLWSLTALGTGLSRNYWELAVARGVSGVGEVSFACLGPPLVLEYAPSNKKSLWIAVFYSAIALGASYGYIFGASIAYYFDAWYYPFYFEAAIIFVLCLLALSIEKDPTLIALKEDASPLSLGKQLKILFQNAQYVFIILGFAAYIFTFGGISFWGPFILQKEYEMSQLMATRIMAGITIGCGFTGTIIGSLILDRNLKRFYDAEKINEISQEKLMFISVEKSSYMLLVVMVLATIFAVGGSAVGQFYYYIIGYAIAAIFLFAYFIYRGKGPVAIAMMNCVEKEMRGQANAVAIFFMHMFGDFPAPFFIGFLFDTFSIYVGVLVLFSWLGFAIIMWGISWNISRFHGASCDHVLHNFFRKSKGLLYN